VGRKEEEGRLFLSQHGNQREEGEKKEGEGGETDWRISEQRAGGKRTLGGKKGRERCLTLLLSGKRERKKGGKKGAAWQI